MLHMTSSDIPDRDLLATIFHIERETDPPRLTGLLQRFIERTNNVDLHAIIVQFATAALARWANVRDEQGQPLVSEQALAAVSNVRDYQMYAQLLQERLDQMVAEGKAEGEAHGKAQERRQSLIATASIYLDPETLDSCQVWLSHCPLDQMPTVHDLVQTAKSAFRSGTSHCGPVPSDRRCRHGNLLIPLGSAGIRVFIRYQGTIVTRLHSPFSSPQIGYFPGKP